MSTYTSLSIEQLEAELTRLHGAQKSVLAEKKQVAAALDAKLVERAALEKFSSLSDAERAALAQLIRANAK